MHAALQLQKHTHCANLSFSRRSREMMEFSKIKVGATYSYRLPRGREQASPRCKVMNVEPERKGGPMVTVYDKELDRVVQVRPAMLSPAG
jgi:hypothetical protein